MTRYVESTTGTGTGHAAVPEVALAVRDLRRSTEPAVVLSSLARSCVPSFSDACVVELSEGLEPVFRVAYPLVDDDPEMSGQASSDDDSQPVRAAPKVVTTSLELRSASGQPSCAGVVIHRWEARVPATNDAVIARLLVDEALAVVRYERLAEVAADADRRSAQLAIETITARMIGTATGIVMASRQLTEQAAVNLLKSASRQTGRSLHDVALEVVLAGGLAHDPKGPTASVHHDPGRARTLRSVRRTRPAS